MRKIMTQADIYTNAHSSEANTDRVQTLAVYGAFALIVGIVFGTLSFHPF